MSITIETTGDDAYTVRTLAGTNRRGLNRVVWDLQAEEVQRLGTVHGMPEFVPAGTYAVKVTQAEASGTVTLQVRAAPGE